MQDDIEKTPNLEPNGPGPVENEILIGRIIDREAGADECAQFEDLAKHDPERWHQLGDRQLDMSRLTTRISEELDAADQVDLPVQSSPRSRVWPFAMVGWAAVILISAAWVLTTQLGTSTRDDGDGRGPGVVMTANQLMDLYRQTGVIEDEFPLVLLDVEDLGNGLYRVYYMRRIEESVVIDRPVESIISDDNGNRLDVDPLTIRVPDPAAPSPN